MYYKSPGNLIPILPREEITPANIADNFDERTVINDDLNMNGYFIYNLKDPEDDQDAVAKIYVDTSAVIESKRIEQRIESKKNRNRIQKKQESILRFFRFRRFLRFFLSLKYFQYFKPAES